MLLYIAPKKLMSCGFLPQDINLEQIMEQWYRNILWSGGFTHKLLDKFQFVEQLIFPQYLKEMINSSKLRDYNR